ncbi:hypothetical protein GLX27_000683 [Malassezia furfur]|uniref:50S ribosomal protein L22 n=1 Tax=Malassezia furfur TaxID=55194 RepID=A0ABY8ENN3_MALFU|nr:hypothetical protein CBS14141_001646 [Malassezia furfur]WFD46055.1 hypothetical protein GLX27_000683 [Malassezia furfur]
MLLRPAWASLRVPRVVPRVGMRAFATNTPRTSFWDTVLPLIQGNRRERKLQRQQGGLLPEDYERVQRDQRRDEMMAAQSSTGDALVDDVLSSPQARADEVEARRAEAKRTKRLLRKRWGGLDENGVEKQEQKYSTAVFRISPRKLNLLANQIIGKPIDFAIVQMQFSAKRAARRVRATLVMARDHAIAKGMDPSKLLVSEAWVTKGTYFARLEIKGRARHGIMHHPQAKLNVVLRPGKTWEEREEATLELARRRMRRLGSGGVTRTNRKIVNGFQRPGWAW